MRKFAERLKELREEKQLSKLALSKILKVGDANIILWERGEQDILSDNLIKISQFFNVSVDYLLGLSNDC